MGRLARVVVPGRPHHVVQRGNRRMETFFNDDDYQTYLMFLIDRCLQRKVAIWAYCLMPNHLHLILVPKDRDGLRAVMGETNRRYARRVNAREGWQGHLWQERFHSFVMDDDHVLAAARYIERNPVTAGLVKRPEKWPWSSAAAHVAGRADPVAESDWLVERIDGWVCTWGEYLRDPKADDEILTIERHQSTGRPLGNEKFIKRLETRLGRSLTPRKRGRPKKVKE